ncbi:MAG: TonB-dependent receptor plug domain-containing protein [Candidatus Omnitrophica bacterium]|nr:TonB-dependent receptor plug domain-containing protein [Candidatus Omnitrophota bacterium]
MHRGDDDFYFYFNYAGKRRCMFRKGVLILLVAVLFSYAAKAEEEKDGFFDVIKKPFQFVLRPVGMEDLGDALFGPVDRICSVTSFSEPVVTPGRTKEYIYNINRNVDIITAREIKDMNALTVQDVLSRRAGIVLNGFFNNSRDNNLDIRGFGSTGNLNYLVLLDGRRINQIDLSGPDLSQIDIRTVEKIEVIRGPNTVMYGDNATGGVVNIITKRGSEGHNARYAQEAGSYRYRKEYFSFEGREAFMDYFISSSWQDSDGYRANNGYEANDIFAGFRIRPAEDISVDLSSGYHRDWYGQPGALYDGNIQSDGMAGTRFPDSKAKTEDHYFSVEPKFLLDGDTETAFSVPFTYRSRRSDALDVSFNRYETHHHIRSFDLRPKFEVSSFLLDDSVCNKLVCGMDYFRAEDQVLSGDIVYTKSQVDIEKETLAFYAENNALIRDRFTLNFGVRGEWAEYSFDQKQPTSSIDEKSLKDLAFDAGAGYKYGERSQLYAIYSRSYRMPTTDEFFQSAYEQFDWWTFGVRVFPAVLNFDLKQQVANNYEIGVKDNTFDRLRIKANYYFMDVKNEIYYDPVSFTNENYHHTWHHGFELEADADIVKGVKLFANYTFQKSLFRGGKYGNCSIPLVPENKFSAGVRMRPLKGFVVEFNADYVGEMTIANDPLADSDPLESRFLMGLTAAYERKGLRIFGIIRNLADHGYFSNATRNWQGNTAFYPAPGRNFQVGASVKF